MTSVSTVALPFDLADLSFDFSHRYPLGLSDGVDVSVLEDWKVTASVDMGDSEYLPLASFEFLRVDLFDVEEGHMDLYRLLAGHSPTAEHFATHVLCQVDTYSEFLGLGFGVLLLHAGEVTEELRGFGLGAWLAAEAVAKLSRECHAAFVRPSPTEGRFSPSAREAVTQRISATAAQAGFQPYRNGYMVYDPSVQLSLDALSRLRRQFGLGS